MVSSSRPNRMPHLQLDVNRKLTQVQKIAVAARFKQVFSEVMDTGTEHKGEDFHLTERYLGTWSEGEDPLR